MRLGRDEAWAAFAVAMIGFGACLAGWLAGGVSVDVPWAPTLNIRLELALDGLGALYALLATGIGALVFAYGAAYMPWHLARERRPPAEALRFWPWMVLFMGSMVGLACALDLVLLFVFFDLTAIASYFLIGFDRHRREARGAALMALLVTGVSAVALLIGAVLLYVEYGTFSLPELFERASPGSTTTAAAALIALAALAKSAQAPLHFWLPRAMEAPTPVSAYLHSAAMVAAGVLVIGRVHPLLEKSDAVLDGLLVVGFVSIAVGGVLALAQDELKQILAYSTISQYGYVVVLYGMGGSAAAGAAALYVVAHAIAKSALFMTAGAITVATDESRLSRLGGLARQMPVLAAASAVACASLAALPLTLGFFKDELFFVAADQHSGTVTALAVAAAALTVAYIARFWLGVFAGRRRTDARRVPALLVVPVAVLGAVTLVGGVVTGPFARLARDAATVTNGAAVDVAPAYHASGSTANLMALVAWAAGAAILLVPRARAPVVRAVARAGDAAGPRRAYGLALAGLSRLSDRLHTLEVRDMRTSIAAVFVPTAVLVAAGFAVTPTRGAYALGSVERQDLPLLPLLALVIAATYTITRDRGRLRPVLALSVLGFALAGVYAVAGAPDVALVAVLVETILTIVFVGALARLPPSAEDEPSPGRRSPHRIRNLVVGVLAGGGAFAAVWAELSRPTSQAVDATEYVRRAPEAHGGDVVTVILADFRGLDTMVEVTVLFVAVFGVASLLRRGTVW
jgi:multicomponent Na+:H+ antiporter subunit A